MRVTVSQLRNWKKVQGFMVIISHLVVDSIMAPQRCPHRNPRNLGICYITWQEGIKVADELKVERFSCIILVGQM